MVWGLALYDAPTGLWTQGAIFLAAVILSAIVSAAEASMIRLPVFPRRHMEELGETESTLARVLKRPNRALVTILLANYLSIVVATAVAVSLSLSLVGANWVGLVTAVVVATMVLLLLGEFVPRAWATVNPARTARSVAPGIAAIEILLFPVIWMLERTSAAILRLFGAPLQHRVFLDEEELKQMVEMGEAQGIIEKEEQEMISAVIDFADLTAGDIMVPRTDMVAVEDSSTVADIVETIRETGYSRIPVYHDDIDTIIGVVYGKDLLGRADEISDVPARRVMQQALFVPEPAHLDEVLRQMKTRRIHIAIVHDEFGGTAGLLSLEDVLEEIVGDIFDEYDPEEAEPVQWLDERTAIVDARLPIPEVNEALETDIPEAAPYETLGGFLFHKLGRPGKAGEVLARNGIEFTLEHVANRRILKVRARRVSEPEEEEG